MLRTTQRRMLRLIIQTKRKCKKKKELGEKDIHDDEMSEDTQQDSTHDEHQQDGSISLDDEDKHSKPRRRFRRLD